MCCLEEGIVVSAHQSHLHSSGLQADFRSLQKSWRVLALIIHKWEALQSLCTPELLSQKQSKKTLSLYTLKIGLSLHQFSKLSGFRRPFYKEICSFKQSRQKILKLAFVGSHEDGEIF